MALFAGRYAGPACRRQAKARRYAALPLLRSRPAWRGPGGSPVTFAGARRGTVAARHSIRSSLRNASSSRISKARSRRKVKIKRQHWISQSNKATRTAREFFSDDGE